MNASMESIAEAWISANLQNYVIDAQVVLLCQSILTFSHSKISQYTNIFIWTFFI